MGSGLHCAPATLALYQSPPSACHQLDMLCAQLEASLTSDFPSLMALNSMRSGKYDGVNTPPELAEKPKYLATPQYKNGTVVSGSNTPVRSLRTRQLSQWAVLARIVYLPEPLTTPRKRSRPGCPCANEYASLLSHDVLCCARAVLC